MDDPTSATRAATATTADPPVRTFVCGRCRRPISLSFAAAPRVSDEAAAVGWGPEDYAFELHLRYGCV